MSSKLEIIGSVVGGVIAILLVIVSAVAICVKRRRQAGERS